MTDPLDGGWTASSMSPGGICGCWVGGRMLLVTSLSNRWDGRG